MKISVNDKVILTLTDVQEKVIMNDIPSEIFEQDMCRRIAYIIMHKYERCMERLKKEWVDGGRLANNGVSLMPTDPEKLAELIFLQSDYRNRSDREKESMPISPDLNVVHI